MPRGGKRHGAGTKLGFKYPKTLEKEAARARYRERMTESFEAVLDAQVESATGIHQFVYRDDKGRFKVIDDPDELRACVKMGKALRIFTRLPATQAQQDVLNRLMDKPIEPKQEVEHSGTIVMRHELGD